MIKIVPRGSGYVMPRVSVRRAILCLLPLLGILATIALWPSTKKNVVPATEPPTQHQALLLPPTVDQPKSKEVTFPKEWPWYMAGKGRPWYMTGGSDGTSPQRTKLFPGENPASDRIEEQLLYAPETKKTKLILVYNGFRTWSNVKAGPSAFSSCPVKDCMLTANKGESVKADAILFNEHFSNPGINRPRGQVWILYMLECPYHTQHIKQNDVFNWTATYRRDSDIVTPYEKWVYYDKDVTSLTVRRNYALNKTKKVAWFVSNCGARNSRLQYAHELQKHIEVDIYGACGAKKCPRSKQEKCFDMLNTDYKFYLAFENSNCQDYITEKFFVNGLGSNVIPIVMGARQEEYERSAPLRSFIHVDEFDSPKALADYLHTIDKDDDLYNSYFRWKGTGEFINTHFFCRMCALLHDRFPAKSYRDINAWWRGPGVCTTTSWKKPKSKWYTSLTQRLS